MVRKAKSALQAYRIEIEVYEEKERDKGGEKKCEVECNIKRQIFRQTSLETYKRASSAEIQLF